MNKIVSSIDEETKKKNQIVKRKHFSLFAKIFYPIAAILVLFLGYYAYSYFKNRDFVVQARDVYESINNNQTKLQYTTSNANELSELMNKSLNFKVFIPDVKGAVLIGGTVNEMNGLRVVHFVHKKNNQIIYTLQVSRNDLFGRNNFVLHKNQEQGILNGQNWIACDKINNDCAVIWFKNDVICSSVSRIEAQEMSNILTNYK